jgi:uncharacterized membrane protein YadS
MNEDYFFIGSGIRADDLQGGLYLVFAMVCLVWVFWVFRKQSAKAQESNEPLNGEHAVPVFVAIFLVMVLLVFFGAILF